MQKERIVSKGINALTFSLQVWTGRNPLNQSRLLLTPTMHVGQALKDAENALRDFISLVLAKEKGKEWIHDSGVPADRVSKWIERRTEDEKRLPTGTPDSRLIYYADFYDLKTILRRNWPGQFKEAFGDIKTTEVFLSQLERLRNPEAHRRELLPHQKHLAIGISGYFRNSIVRYRSTMETSDSYYPRLESVADSLGNSWAPGRTDIEMRFEETGARLRIGDTIQFMVAATDPQGMSLEYACHLPHRRGPALWQDSNVLTVTISKEDVRKRVGIAVRIRSNRDCHAAGSHDDEVLFGYEVLPQR